MKTHAWVAAFLLLLPAPAGASSPWSWAHPLPQGHTLYDVDFLDNNTAIAVGEFGTVIVTHDAGMSWTVSWPVNDVTSSLFKVESLDASTAIVVGKQGIVLRTADQGATWQSIPSGTSIDLLDVSFFDAWHGIIIAGSRALRTSDGGFTWHSAALSPTLNSADMISATEAVGLGYYGTVARTSDGGETWSPTTSPETFPGLFVSVDFLDALHGAIVSRNYPAYDMDATSARCYLTADGGATWTSSDLHSGSVMDDYIPGEVIYPSSTHVLVTARIQCCVLSAIDPPPVGEIGRSEFSNWNNSAVSCPMHGLAENADGIALVVGENGRIIRRETGGALVDVGGSTPPLNKNPDGGSAFADAQAGIVFTSDGMLGEWFGTGDTYFARTTDGGQSWSNSYFGATQCLDAAFLSPSEVIAVGMDQSGMKGSLLRSLDGGATWSQIWLDTAPNAVRAVAATSPTHAVAVGAGATALLIDGGVVTPVATTGANYSDIAFAGPNTLLAVGSTDSRSLDGGLTWEPGPATDVFALAFATSTRVFGVNSTGIMRSDNTGDTWIPVPSGATSGLLSIAFSDAVHGMAVGSQALVTEDGGTTWTQIDKPTSRTFTDVTMIAPGLAFVSGNQELMWRYETQNPVPTLIRFLEVKPRRFGADLRWNVSSDGSLSSFTITRASGASRVTVATGLAATTRLFQDEGLVPGTTYEYQLIAVEHDGSYVPSAPASVTIPRAAVELLPNQPNPFNPVTTLRFVVPERSLVQLTVHDASGRLVATLVDGTRNAAMHAVTWDAVGLASGVYFARLRVGRTEVSRKLVLLK